MLQTDQFPQNILAVLDALVELGKIAKNIRAADHSLPPAIKNKPTEVSPTTSKMKGVKDKNHE